MTLAKPDTRIGLTFHRSFPLNLPAVAKVLNVSRHQDVKITAATIRQHTDLGTIYIEAMPRYARGCGLLEMGNYQLTPLGEVVFQRDPNLSHPSTLWLMHYHLSAPHGPGPAFWSHLVAQSLPFGEEIRRDQLVDGLARFLKSQSGAASLQERTVKSTATVFLGTYSKSDGLGRLGLLAVTGAKDSDSIRVREPQSPPLGVVAYALADYWENQPYRDQISVSLSALTRDDGFARLMWMDPQRLEEALDALRRDGVLDLYRQAPPHQVAPLWSSKRDLLARLYD